MKAPNAEETASQPVRQPPQIVPSIVLRGAGTLPDFSTAAKNDASLNFYLIEADQLRFETLDTYHDLLTKMIVRLGRRNRSEKNRTNNGNDVQTIF